MEIFGPLLGMAFVFTVVYLLIEDISGNRKNR